MKYLFLLSLVIAAGCQSADQPAKVDSQSEQTSSPVNDSTSFTSIQWLDSVNTELGKISEGQVVEVSWRFKNTGDKPLVVQNVQAGCGCTVAEKPTAPIAPGDEGVIKAKFDSKNQGPRFNKTVTVTANTKDKQAHYLSFSGEAIK